MKKIRAFFACLILFGVTAVFAACPVCQKVSFVPQCCNQMVIKRDCCCKTIKYNPCTGKVQKSFMGRTLDTTKSVYSATLAPLYESSIGALYNAYID